MKYIVATSSAVYQMGGYREEYLMKKRYLNALDYNDVLSHYDARVKISETLQDLLKNGDKDKYSMLALGVSDPYGNYSASQHGLGEKILSATSTNKIFELAENLNLAKTGEDVRRIISSSNIQNIKISVGTEMAMLLQPSVHWLANSRSIWAYLLEIKGDVNVANEALELYLSGSDESQMKYLIWSQIHKEMEKPLRAIANQGISSASISVVPNNVNSNIFIWADAIANALYENF